MDARVCVLVSAYVAATAWMVGRTGDAQEAVPPGPAGAPVASGAVSNHDAAVGEEVVVILLDGTAVHGTVGQLLPSGYVIFREGRATTVPFTQVSKIVHVGAAAAPVPAPAAAPLPAPTAAPYAIPATQPTRPELPPDFPTRPRKPGAGLVGAGWPLFGVGWIGAVVFFNLGMWIPGGWDYYSNLFYPFLAGALLGLTLAIIGHGINKRARRAWLRERNELLNPGATTVGRAVELQLFSPMVFDGGGGLGMSAVF
jgi:hypothetical protein